MRETKSLDLILEGFDPAEAQDTTLEAAVTVWLPKGYKERWKQGQQMSRQRLSKLARELLMAAIDKAVPKAG